MRHFLQQSFCLWWYKMCMPEFVNILPFSSVNLQVFQCSVSCVTNLMSWSHFWGFSFPVKTWKVIQTLSIYSSIFYFWFLCVGRKWAAGNYSSCHQAGLDGQNLSRTQEPSYCVAAALHKWLYIVKNNVKQQKKPRFVIATMTVCQNTDLVKNSHLYIYSISIPIIAYSALN